jgi:hypothetical protein
MVHPVCGFMNASMNHGGQGVCMCEHPKDPFPDMPLDECQAISLVENWMPTWLDKQWNGRGGRSGRFEARRIWAKKMGITGIRVDLPPCVKKVILERFGPGSSIFVAGKNKCPCETCVNYCAEQEVALAEANVDDAVYGGTA